MAPASWAGREAAIALALGFPADVRVQARRTGLAFDGPIVDAIDRYERELGLTDHRSGQNDDFAIDSLADV